MCQKAFVSLLVPGLVLSGVQFWDLSYVLFLELCSNVVEIAVMLAVAVVINRYF